MPDAASNLVFLYARAGRLVDAEKLAQRPPADPRFAGLAQSSLFDGCTDRGRRLGDRGKQDEAIAWMRSCIENTPDPAIQHELTKYLESLAAASATDWSDFQLAVDKANARKYAEALKIADRLLAKTADRVFREQVQTFRKDVARRAAKK
jgi:hypothetical protein